MSRSINTVFLDKLEVKVICKVAKLPDYDESPEVPVQLNLEVVR